MLRIDIGCGSSKQEGFLGIDRTFLPGVDIIADLNHPLPFPDSVASLVVASHSLEHVADLLATIKEIYRISSHGAQLCVIAPYSDQKLNLVNPYHRWAFNEHTPRFWTSDPTVRIDPLDVHHPHAVSWGLSKSDNSNPGIDFRLVRLEFFYFPQFLGLTPAEQREHRLQRWDVCDQIMYHLIAWKEEDCTPTGFDEMVGRFVPFYPDFICERRQRDRRLLQDSKIRRAQRVTLVRAAGRDLRLEAEPPETQREQVHMDNTRRNDIDYGESLQSEAMHHWQWELARCQQANADLVSQQTKLTAELATVRNEVGATSDLRRQSVEDRNALIGAQAEVLRLTGELVQAARGRQRSEERVGQLTAELVALRGLYDKNVSRTAVEVGRLSSACADLSGKLGQSQELGQRFTEALHEVKNELSVANTRIAELEAAARRSEEELRIARDYLRREAVAAEALRKEGGVLMEQVRVLRANFESCEVLKAKSALLQAELEAVSALLNLARKRESQLESDLRDSQAACAAAAQDSLRWNVLWNGAKESMAALTEDIRSVPSAPVLRLGAFGVSRSLPRPEPAGRLERLEVYCREHIPGARHAAISLGPDLRQLPYTEYRLDIDISTLRAISVAVCPRQCSAGGMLGVEVVNVNSSILGQVLLPLADIAVSGLAIFRFPEPLVELRSGWLLRVFCRNAESPVIIYELWRSAALKNARRIFPLVRFE